MKEKNLRKGKKQILLQISMGILIILLASSVFADEYKFFCLNKGDKIEYSKCNPKMDDYTCTLDHCNNICLNEVSPEVYCSTDPDNCDGMSCSSIGGGTIDQEPPVITLNNPDEGAIYNKRSVLFDVGLDEPADLYYTDLDDGRGRWTRVCQKCTFYSRERSFDEGLNNIQIKAVDIFGNVNDDIFVSFFLDSKKPQIHKTEPRNGFVRGDFLIQYTELNLAEIKIYYGNTLTGMKEKILSGCKSGKKQDCPINLDLKTYNGQEIEYWFNVRDIAGNNISSSKKKLTVDTTFPVVNSFTYNILGKYVYPKFNITETNFDSVEYQDSAYSEKWKTLCSSLKNGICDRKITLKPGTHKLNFQIMDEAGNTVPAETSEFMVA